ncbi:ABC transporter transmembrane domain-containing protein [Nonomuraea ferruginea]
MNPSIRWLAGAVGAHRRAFVSTLAANLLGQLAALGAAVTGAWLAGRAIARPRRAPRPGSAPCSARWSWWPRWPPGGRPTSRTTWRTWCWPDSGGQVYDAVARITPARLLGRRSGDLSAAALSDIETLEWLFAHTLAQLITAGTVLTAGSVAAAMIDPLLLTVSLPLAACVLAVPLWLRKASRRHGDELRAATAELTADVVDTVQGMRELTAFRALERRRDLLARKTRRLARAHAANAARGGLEAALTDLLLAVAAAGTLLLVVTVIRTPAAAPRGHGAGRQLSWPGGPGGAAAQGVRHTARRRRPGAHAGHRARERAPATRRPRGGHPAGRDLRGCTFPLHAGRAGRAARGVLPHPVRQDRRPGRRLRSGQIHLCVTAAAPLGSG